MKVAEDSFFPEGTPKCLVSANFVCSLNYYGCSLVTFKYKDNDQCHLAKREKKSFWEEKEIRSFSVSCHYKEIIFVCFFRKCQPCHLYL